MQAKFTAVTIRAVLREHHTDRLRTVCGNVNVLRILDTAPQNIRTFRHHRASTAESLHGLNSKSLDLCASRGYHEQVPSALVCTRNSKQGYTPGSVFAQSISEKGVDADNSYFRGCRRMYRHPSHIMTVNLQRERNSTHILTHAVLDRMYRHGRSAAILTVILLRTTSLLMLILLKRTVRRKTILLDLAISQTCSSCGEVQPTTRCFNTYVQPDMCQDHGLR